MYSLEQRAKAVELYIKYCFHSAKVIKELGYPTFKMLPIWFNEFLVKGSLHVSKKRYSKFIADQRITAIAHYFKHGQCVARTVKALGGYQSRPLLKQWVEVGNIIMESNGASGAHLALTFEYGLVNDFFVRMEYKEKGTLDGIISANDYFEWKITCTHA
jgi:hypothetical protein